MKPHTLKLLLPLGLLLVLAFVPILLMVSMSFRRSVDIFADYWALPFPLYLENYAGAAQALFVPALITMLVCAVSIVGLLFLSVMAAYAFGRLQFFGRDVLYFSVIALLMIPGIILLTPNYVLLNALGLWDSLWGLILFYVAGGQIIGIFFLRNFFRELPAELFESSRMDGASEWQNLFHIALPLSRPVLITIGILTFLGFYNDLIWPMLVISDLRKETLMLALLHFNPPDPETSARPDLGVQAAGYVSASIPILIVFWFCMKAYLQGITAGAIKG